MNVCTFCTGAENPPPTLFFFALIPVHAFWLWHSKSREYTLLHMPINANRITFSFCISLLVTEILIFISSISCSGRTWTLGQESQSSRVWNIKSARGMYHLHSYCWWRLQKDRKGKDGNKLTLCVKNFRFWFSTNLQKCFKECKLMGKSGRVIYLKSNRQHSQVC